MTKTARTTTVSVRIDKPTAAEWREKAEASDLSLSDWMGSLQKTEFKVR
ncbi:MAG: hypothetical protein ACRC7D_01870 [Aeromonas popoffii]